MNSFHFVLPFLGAGCLVLGLLAASRRNRRTPRKQRLLEVSPRYRSFFRQRGLTDPEHFLALPGSTPHIVSGHPDRHVARVSFGPGSPFALGFLKREHRVTWKVRLGNALAGFGLVSRSLREARTLQALEREGILGPEWLAAGEDGRGRAFLLVREVPSVELRAFLGAETDPARRRRVADNLGRTLARLHNAGFHHPDLYANHVLIDPRDDSVRVLDWQRARLVYALTWRRRLRDLAALHATVNDRLATPGERLLCLRAYRKAGPCPEASWRSTLALIATQARRLLARRHIREKRQPPARPQAWICLGEGETLCVAPDMRRRYGDRVPDWLHTGLDSYGAGFSLAKRWPNVPGSPRTLFVQRRERKWIGEFWRRLNRQPLASPEQRQAALLLRLQRHALAAPQVLALGQRRGDGGRVESFLLTEPIPDTCGLETWLARQTRRPTRAARKRTWSVLRQTGEFLRHLHEASCYLAPAPGGCGLAVRQANGALSVVLETAEGVSTRRRQDRGRANRDLKRLRQILRTAGCSRTDLCRFQTSYRKADSPPASIQPPTPEMSASEPGTSRLAQVGSLWERLLHGVRRLCMRRDWPRFAGPDWADRIMDVAVTDRLNIKQGRSTGRWILAVPRSCGANGRLSVYLKRHYELPWWQGLLATFWPWQDWSPALREWRHLEWARRQGVPVPRAVAAAEYIGPRLRLRSFLAVEELSGMVSLQEGIPLAAVRQDSASFRHWKRTLAAEMARLARMLHDRRCFHKDLYLCHFYIARDDTSGVPPDGWRGRVHLIDLHRLAHHPWTWRFWQSKDLAQLLYSSEIVSVGARDRLYFWRQYRGTELRRHGCRWLRRLTLLRWRRYRLHNARNKNGRAGAPPPRADGRWPIAEPQRGEAT
jgi:heptose I phosphotransferase